jgi:hypothetical protein
VRKSGFGLPPNKYAVPLKTAIGEQAIATRLLNAVAEAGLRE